LVGFIGCVKNILTNGETNAGYGSNLTELGTVEMDAGLMDGESLLFGAVGAVPGIKNPILVAKLLVQEQRNGEDHN
jgi:taspase (threonine aspartase 1)